MRAGIAQLVEHNLAKVEVASSSLVSRFKFSNLIPLIFIETYCLVFLPLVNRVFSRKRQSNWAANRITDYLLMEKRRKPPTRERQAIDTTKTSLS